MIHIGRALPFLRIITSLEGLRDMIGTVSSIIGLVGEFSLVYVGISYGFAIVGMEIFGSVTQTDAMAYCQQCQMYKMDTLAHAFQAILQVSVGNK